MSQAELDLSPVELRRRAQTFLTDVVRREDALFPYITIVRDGESRGIAASSPTPGWPSVSVRSGSGFVISGGWAVVGWAVGGLGAVGFGRVSVPEPPEENEIEPPAL